MGYQLHIERPDEVEISDSEWESAVSEIPTLRFAQSNVTGTPPTGGLTITIKSEDIDVEVLFETGGFLGLFKKKEWIYAFSFSEGTASFSPPRDIDDQTDPVMKAARLLCKKLDAKIRGDDGEEYE
ncbi:hypothetical protein [Pelagicoccus sp. SDUM812003]|uniref:hypothetical protein n=1 Tax=Pelagicoccus sp. SDUM812003 TaxID=3041267 RepID=UPI00280FB8DB|nr:hypothetical protein [Pelagicoccus sp. SDUM812003]MDQ8205866.1 hypothetical protein [Pelagicoccus sp. SDUM812003]